MRENSRAARVCVIARALARSNPWDAHTALDRHGAPRLAMTGSGAFYFAAIV
jgi:hypothetical protein